MVRLPPQRRRFVRPLVVLLFLIGLVLATNARSQETDPIPLSQPAASGLEKTG